MAKRRLIKEGVEELSLVIEQGPGAVKVIEAARSLSDDPTYNLTCFLMANYGAVMTGMQGRDWKREVGYIKKILAKK